MGVRAAKGAQVCNDDDDDENSKLQRERQNLSKVCQNP